jgi:hypothetical protein
MALLRAILAGFFGCLLAVVILRIPAAIVSGDDATVEDAVTVALVVLALAGAAAGAVGAWEGLRAGLSPVGARLMGAAGAIAYGAVLSAGPGDAGYTILGLGVLTVGAAVGATVPALRPRPASPGRPARRRPGRYRPAGR